MGKQTERQQAKNAIAANVEKPSAEWTHEVQLTPEEYHELMSRPLKFNMEDFMNAVNEAHATAHKKRPKRGKLVLPVS